MGSSKVAQGGEFDNRLHVIFEQHRQHHHIPRNRFEQAGANRNGLRRQVGDDKAAFFCSALSDQTLSAFQAAKMAIFAVACEGCQHHHALFALHLVNHSLLSVDQRHKLRQESAADRGEVALSLEHARKPGQIRLQPVLLRIAVGGQTKVVDHGVDVVFQFRHLATGFDLNGSGQIAFGDGGGNFGDRANLVGQIVSKQVDIARKVLPGTGSARNVSLTTEPAFHTDFAGDGRHLVGKGGECASHVVNRLGKSSNLALCVHTQFLGKFTIGHGSHDFHNAADLLSQVSSHHVDVVRQIFPRACNAGHLSLTSEFAFGSHFASHTGHFGGKSIELVHHRVDGVF